MTQWLNQQATVSSVILILLVGFFFYDLLYKWYKLVATPILVQSLSNSPAVDEELKRIFAKKKKRNPFNRGFAAMILTKKEQERINELEMAEQNRQAPKSPPAGNTPQGAVRGQCQTTKLKRKCKKPTKQGGPQA